MISYMSIWSGLEKKGTWFGKHIRMGLKFIMYKQGQVNVYVHFDADNKAEMG